MTKTDYFSKKGTKYEWKLYSAKIVFENLTLFFTFRDLCGFYRLVIIL